MQVRNSWNFLRVSHTLGMTAVVSILILLPLRGMPHGGGLDRWGCHHNRKQGGYHCHRGKLAGRYFSSKAQALKALDKLEPRKYAKERPVVWRKVERIIDGDTIVLDGEERIRLIGVDTPETVHPTKPVEYFGKEASAFTKKIVHGKEVRLEYDEDTKDRYGRTLAYVYLKDGTFLNAEIVKQGFGFAYTRFPFRYMEEFRKYEREARETGRGLWKDR